MIKHRPRFATPSHNRGPFPSSPGPLYQNEVKCSTFDMEVIFHSRANKTHFHKRLWTWPHFESEGFRNSEVAYSSQYGWVGDVVLGVVNLVPRALFPGFGQGKAPLGRGWGMVVYHKFIFTLAGTFLTHCFILDCATRSLATSRCKLVKLSMKALRGVDDSTFTIYSWQFYLTIMSLASPTGSFGKRRDQDHPSLRRRAGKLHTGSLSSL